MGDKTLEIVNLIFTQGGEPTVCFRQRGGHGSDDKTFALTLDELETSIHRMMLARHMLTIHKNHESCPDCTLDAIGKVGG